MVLFSGKEGGASLCLLISLPRAFLFRLLLQDLFRWHCSDGRRQGKISRLKAMALLGKDGAGRTDTGCRAPAQPLPIFAHMAPILLPWCLCGALSSAPVSAWGIEFHSEEWQRAAAVHPAVLTAHRARTYGYQRAPSTRRHRWGSRVPHRGVRTGGIDRNCSHCLEFALQTTTSQNITKTGSVSGYATQECRQIPVSF